MRILVFVFFCLSGLGLSSCSGYTILNSSAALSDLGRSMRSEGIYLAPIDKDSLGQLTSALIYELGKRSLPIRNGESCARYLLKVQLLNEVDENTGFTYAPNKIDDKTPRHFIVSSEGRLSISAKVQLIDRRSGKVVVDDCVSRRSVSFDFEPDLGMVNAQQFALGQFEMHNEAIKSAWRVLYAHLAETIVQQVYYDLF
ncbi:LPS assembly lipoprotein LptE [Chlamydia crocodili]|uniref:Lipopolysaccharide-assembly family protein n=1 Tax=Chlamydia crocodili TaxID=2766982 RepID=A0ABX8CDW1_9CHLA|nr:LPS assembly lipoprotein LptE [Chlamydia crocodili]QVE48629.1 lipopolysaccharide-assembly family protein [Chlamydia crocodili]